MYPNRLGRISPIGETSPNRKGIIFSSQEANGSPTVRTVWVAPDSGIYGVPISTGYPVWA
jgi:hypothetical protein